MAEAFQEFDKIRGFAKVLRKTKCDIDKEYTVKVSPLLSESKFKKHTVEELDEGIESMEEALNSLNEISSFLVKVKHDFQDAKIQILQKQLRQSQIRDRPGRLLGHANDSGCYSVDSRLLSAESNLITQTSDADQEEDSTTASRVVTSIHTEATQHEDTSGMPEEGEDRIC